MLVLGAAGMSLGKGARCSLAVTFVDIDPAQERIAERFLEMPAHEAAGSRPGRPRLAAGRRGGWEAIVVDTYSNSRTLPQHLLTAEFYRLARSRLADAGSLYVNHLTWPRDALFRTRAERTLRSVFADCSAWPVGIEQGPRMARGGLRAGKPALPLPPERVRRRQRDLLRRRAAGRP